MKKILIISPYFAPENAVASIRFTKIAKYLENQGYDISVICSDNMAVSKKDRILECDSSNIKNIYRIPPLSFNKKIKKIYSIFEENSKKKKTKNEDYKITDSEKKSPNSVFESLISSKLYHAFLENWIYLMEILQGYVFIKFAKKNRESLREIDCVISTYGPISSHILAKYLKKNSMCKKWIADFRDVVYDVMGEETRIDVRRKRKLANACVEADYVTAITDEMLNSLKAYVDRFYKKDISNKVHCIPNGFDPEERKYLEKGYCNDCLEFSYCGVIYMSENKLLRDPRPLFQAIFELIQEKRIIKEKILFNYAGRTFKEFYEVAKQYGLEEQIYNHGFVERIDSLNIQRKSDIVLSLSWNTKKDKGIMTGKIFEAFLVERNVLCLISGDEPNSDLKKMIESNNIGFVWEEGSGKDISQIKDWLMQEYNEKMSCGTLSYHGDKEKINRYSYEYLTQKFENILNMLVSL